MPHIINTQTPALTNPTKLVFFDIDGTLLNTDGDYSPNLKQQIQRLHSLGIKTAIASGRPYFAADFLFKELSLLDAGVFCTGAMLYDPRTHTKLLTHSLDSTAVQGLCDDARIAGLYCELYSEDEFFIEPLSAANALVSRIHNTHLRCQSTVTDFAPLLDSSRYTVTKLLLGVDTRLQPDALQQLAAKYPEFDFAYAGFLACPGWLFASVIHKNADKSVAFDTLLHHHNVSAEQVIALGDSHSDEVFLSKAGVGIAMGNANASVQACANYVTHSVDDDGVAFALQQLVR